MKRKFKILTLLLSAVIMFSACEEDERAYSDVDPFNDDLKTVALVSSSSTTVVIDPESATTVYNIGVKVNGKVPAQDMSIELVIDETNLTADQYDLAGSSIVIPAGKNQGSIALTLYKDEFFPGEVFTLEYSLGTPSFGEINELGASGTITMYNPGFLGPWVGSYTGAAASLNEPGDWDESWDVSTELDPTAPLERILIYGIAGANLPLVATLDPDELTIVIEGGQNIGNVYGYGDSYVYYGEPPYNFYAGVALEGTLSEDGTMEVPNMGLTTGPYGWDVFDVTFTKSGKKSSGNAIPTRKPGPKL